MRKRQAAPRSRLVVVAFLSLWLLIVLYRTNMSESGGLFTGSVVAAVILLLIAVSLRRNREALAALRRRGPKYDVRTKLDAERRRMLSRRTEDPIQEERT